MNDRLLDQKLLRRAFELLAKHLKRRGVVGEVHVFGGAAMVLAFNSRQATRDVDAVNERLAAQVGVEQCCGDTQFVQCDQRGEKLDAVFHHQAHRVATHQTARGQLHARAQVRKQVRPHAQADRASAAAACSA